MIITTRDDLRRYVSDAIGSEGTDAMIDAVTERLWERAWTASIVWGDDWSAVLDLTDDEWLDILDRASQPEIPDVVSYCRPPTDLDDDDEDLCRLTE